MRVKERKRGVEHMRITITVHRGKEEARLLDQKEAHTGHRHAVGDGDGDGGDGGMEHHDTQNIRKRRRETKRGREQDKTDKLGTGLTLMA
jgi:hypothetical protein